MAEYIWIDGYEPTAGLRSKTKILDNIRDKTQNEQSTVYKPKI